MTLVNRDRDTSSAVQGYLDRQSRCYSGTIGGPRENVVFRCGLDEPQIGSSRAAAEVVSRAQIYHQSMNENQIASTKSFIVLSGSVVEIVLMLPSLLCIVTLS